MNERRFKVGDKVRVRVRSSVYFGKEGVVINDNRFPEFDYDVRLDGVILDRLGFDDCELELVASSETSA